MLPQPASEYLKELLSKQLNRTISSLNMSQVGGGSISNSYRVAINDTEHFFLKLNSPKQLPALFEKEKAGLQFLARQNCIQTPTVIACITDDNYQLLLLEWIEPGPRNDNFWKTFGGQLAQLHAISYESFGFFSDNYMGALPQANPFTKSWTTFFIDYRLQIQIRLASEQGLLQNKHRIQFESLFKKLDAIFNIEKPSLLHGDLWSGNFMCNSRSLPVLIDPAVYYGHRSMDLAMTTLFSGFDKLFYDSYQERFPFPVNYREQWELCNLYPLLVHLNLFGTSYLQGIESTLKRFA